jgi:polar amino acid transport system permease protein
MLDILRHFGILFLIGSYPQGPLGGLAGTLLLSVLGLVFSFPLALVLGLMRTSSRRWLLWPSSAWVYTLRGLPLLMIIFWAYFGIPLLVGKEVSAFTTVICAIVIYESAFLGEVVRAGLEGLPRGQFEAARSIGLTHLQAMRHVLMPQALANMLPSLVNQFVSIIKATSLAYVIGVHEVTLAASQVNSMLLTKPMQVFLILAAMYFVVCFSLSRAADALERRIARRRAGLA